ncbi:hypothetical protein ACFYO2_43240 [Streptomyces sp. NPDC006602]|uniref:hypothetical protein n=1 Tax=Streptomyces sp. NPDC006602 TaxID=3364751 RepID=UPI003688F96B
MNEDDIARAVAQGLRQYDAERRAAERRRARQMVLVLLATAFVFGLQVLASFLKL